MAGSAAQAPPIARTRRSNRKRADRYHHGDLRRALLEEALRTIQTHGVEALTLRAVGERLGVSRTALYRHFTDKPALLKPHALLQRRHRQLIALYLALQSGSIQGSNDIRFQRKPAAGS